MGAIRNVSGIPATPIFAEVILQAAVPLANGGTRPFLNVFHFRQISVVPALGVLADLKTSVNGALEAALEDALSIQYQNGKFKARWMDDPTFAYDTPNKDIDGTVTGDRATAFNAVTIQMRSDARGRNFRGSKHFGPIAESQTTLDDLNAGAITKWQAVADAIASMVGTVSGGNATSWTPIILSPTLSDLEASPCVFTFADLTDCVLNNTVGTMRRRRERGGVS